MTKPKEAPETAMVVSHALTGSLDEKVRAFEQMAAAMAQLQINGWDSVQKCKAGFWLADGAGEHPAVFVQSHYVMLIKGRLTVEPKWEYMVRKLKETVPGFRFEVIEESDELATVKMSDGVDSHVVTYSVEDARRQGLMNANNAWSTGSTREMCFKQAVKRCARRIGVGRVLPWVEMDMPEQIEERDAKGEAEKAISGAVVVDEAGESPKPNVDAVASGNESKPDPGSEAHIAGRPQPSPPAKVERPAIMRLSDALIVKYGKQTKAVMLEKATFVYNEMVKANTGVSPGTTFKKVEDIGPVDAELMIEFLEHGGQTIGEALTSDIAANADKLREAVEPKPADDEPPPAETADAPIEDGEDGEDYERFMLAVKRAKKLFGRTFMKEAPPGSGRYWFIDQATFSQAGYPASLKIMSEDGEVVVGQDVLRQLTTILVTDCDAQERGRP